MKQKRFLLGYYNYTVILTYIGLLAGFFGIVNAFGEKSVAAVVCLMFAGFCDMFDGTVASTRKRTDEEKCFGIQIDSLSDIICFCMLPAMIVYSMSSRRYLTIAVCALYVLCGLIRLAYFNVDEQERQKISTGSRELYYGMPVTLSALFLPLIYSIIKILPTESTAALVILLFVMAVLFVLPFPLKKPHTAGKICVVLAGAAEIVLLVLACVVF